MDICYLPGRETSYARTRTFLKGMRAVGLGVLDCSCPRKNVLRYVTGFWKFLIHKGKSDIILVGFLGHFLMPLVKLFTRKPVMFDAFVSLYQTMVLDRQVFMPRGPGALAAKFMDRLACRLADAVLLDTDAHIEFFVSELGIERRKLHRIPASADDSVMYPRPAKAASGPLVVHFHCEFQRLHGAEYVIRAAGLCPDIRFRIIGSGRTLPECTRLARELGLQNVEFIPTVTYERLADYMAEADVCLGIFGDTQKARLVIPNKVCEALAMGKAVITADTPAARELLTDGENALLCKAADAEAIAEALGRLLRNPGLRETIARNGERAFRENCSPAKAGEMIAALASTLAGKPPA